MEKVFVINFSDAIILEREQDVNTKFYDETYISFDDAKKELIAYWDKSLQDAKNTLKEVKKMNCKDIKTFN